MKLECVLNCSFNSWYPKFENFTIRSQIISLNETCLKYFRTDGIDMDEASEELKEIKGILEESVCKSIKDIGGSVFPKLNWSSPKDATWIAAGQTLECHTLEDILVLLKSSDFIYHDLNEAFLYCDPLPSPYPKVDFCLVLREWTEIPDWSEFRCFVKNNKLVGICQRHYNSFFPNVIDSKNEIKDSITKFFDSNVLHKFPSSNYTFDVFVKEKSWEVTLVDFNPWGVTTEPLLFSWDELNSEIDSEGGELSMKIVEEKTSIKSSTTKHFGYPAELYSLGVENLNELLNAATEAVNHLSPTNSDQNDK